MKRIVVLLIMMVMMNSTWSMHKQVSSQRNAPCTQPLSSKNIVVKKPSSRYNTTSTYYDVSRYDYHYPYLGGYWGNPYGYWGYDYYPYSDCACVGIGLDAWGSDFECYPY